MAFERNVGPKIVLSITIILMVTNYYLSPQLFQDIGKYIKEFVVVIAAVMLGLGFINALLRDIPKITKKEPGQWYFSLLTIIFIFVMLFLCAGNKYMPGTFSGMYSFLYQEVYRVLGNAIGAFAAFFVFTATFRAMRLRTLESGAFTISHILAVLGNAPIGAVIWPGIPIIADWINEVVVSAGLRGFIITSSLGGVILVFRYVIGKIETVLGSA